MSYSGVIASGIDGALNLGTEFAATVTGGSLAINRSSTGSGAIDWSTVPGLSTVELSGDIDDGRRYGRDHQGLRLLHGWRDVLADADGDHDRDLPGDTLSDFELTLDPTTPLLIGTSDYGLSLTSGTVRLLSLTGAPGAPRTAV